MKTFGKSVCEEIALFCGLVRSQFVIIPWLLFSGLALAQANTFYVWPESVASAPPYTNWDTAARTIQEAVDVAQPGDTVLVTNGIYGTGGRTAYGLITNRVVIDKAVTVQSVNGPEQTLIVGAPNPNGTNGAGAVRCCYVGTNAVLSGFTLTNGYTLVIGNSLNQDYYGGGALATPRSVLSNCVVVSNWAFSYGGGVCYGILNDCRLTNNTSLYDGGGLL